jgi:hypothetical protein
MDDDFLSRWSRRKKASRRPGAPAEEKAPASAAATPAAVTPATALPAAETAPLPPVESLTPESDFAPFMTRDVDPGLRRQALRTLFQDPRFNVMDGLDVYIDDYSKPDPIPADWMGKLEQLARLDHGIVPEPKEPEPIASAPESVDPEAPEKTPRSEGTLPPPSDTSA